MTQPPEKSNHGSPLRVEHSLMQALRDFPGLAPLEETELLAIIADSANLRWAAGNRVIASGSEADGLYVVISGSVEVRDPGGGPVSSLGPGDYVGEFSLLLGTPRLHDVVAVEDAELMVVPRERITRLFDDHPDLARDVRARLEARLAENARAGMQAEP